MRPGLATLVGLVALGCAAPRREPPLSFTVQHVFYIKPPVDRVMLVGVVNQGAVRKGDRLAIHTKNALLEATVEGIERIREGEIPAASAGDQVALRVVGVSRDAVDSGDTITKHEGA